MCETDPLVIKLYYFYIKVSVLTNYLLPKFYVHFVTADLISFLPLWKHREMGLWVLFILATPLS